MSKVVIVGVEGSGKTVLMSTVVEMFGTPSDASPYLHPENPAATSFMADISPLLREKELWPKATAVDALRELAWSLRIGSEAVTEIKVLDYSGDLYRLAFAVPRGVKISQRQ